jgi:hypothetical protein
LNELDSQLAQASVELDLVGKGLIDYFFLRLVQVLVVMGVVLFLIVLLVLSVFRRRSAGMIDRDASTE